MKDFQKIGVVYKKSVETAHEISTKICDVLKSKGIKTSLHEINSPDKNVDFAIIVGGDGTILRAARFFAPYGIPIFGINLGRLGFLAQANAQDVGFALEKLFNSEFKIDERLMLSLKNETATALNDIVVKGLNLSRTVELEVYINDRLVCNYLADGLIISTPTGSTAYTLSAGGPVLTPSLDAFVIVPICPHTLAARPLVVPSGEVIEVKCKEPLSVCIDGQIDFEPKGVVIEKSPYKAKIVLLKKENNGFYSVLREKFNWGTSPKGC